MTPQAQARSAYTEGKTPIRTERGTEYELLARVTHKMRAAAARGKFGFAALAEAVQHNRQLWTMLAAHVADGDNALPRDLRARIFYLSEFTRSHSQKVLKQGASIAPLVEINAAVMRGLRAQGAET